MTENILPPEIKDRYEKASMAVNKKNYDYARGGKPTGNFDRVANILKQYPGLDPADTRVVALIYLLKQFDAVLWMLAQGYEGDVEGIDKRLEDVSVYSVIIRVLNGEIDA